MDYRTVRKKKSKRSIAIQKGYRSGLEDEMVSWLKIHKIAYEYESKECKFSYIRPSTDHLYTCDFMLLKKDGGYMYVETKGKWDAGDREKMYLVKKFHPEIDIRMAFQGDPTKKWVGKKGVTSYADVCTKGKGRNRKPYKWNEFNIPFCWADVGTMKSRFALMLPHAWMNELTDEQVKSIRKNEL